MSEVFSHSCRTTPAEFVRLDQEILTPLAGKKRLFYL
jgi:hypothetical protein